MVVWFKEAESWRGFDQCAALKGAGGWRKRLNAVGTKEVGESEQMI